MKLTYDKEANAAYIYLLEDTKLKVAKTYPCDPIEVGGMINLDFDNQGRLMGIEVLDASRMLDDHLLISL
jgi:uncharacterized protein YuzE